MRRRWLLVAVLLTLLPMVPAQADTYTIFAAASLKNALDAAVAAYQKETGDTVRVSYAASSALARQIEAGAPADIFISADLKWMDELQGKNLIQTNSRRNLLGNELVLVAPVASHTKIDLKPGVDLLSHLKNGPLAMADPAAVPAGIYGKAALTKLGIWSSVEAKVARAEDVRAALRLVARGEAPLGIVYRTDANAEPQVEVAGVFPPDSYPPVTYPTALVAHAQAHAKNLLNFLESPSARPYFEKQGFKVLF
ncbi:MAG TPA: molybdate ABC transporter substrate-binding protein [Stellaceae bacterium]|nr:molybdate ABC transporter substrate-binding protein [Stellaceae bacterium]